MNFSSWVKKLRNITLDDNLVISYFDKCYDDLVRHVGRSGNSNIICPNVFNMFMDLPLIVTNRIFDIFSKCDKNEMSRKDFLNCMLTLYCSISKDRLILFTFEVFRSGDKINKDDFRVILNNLMPGRRENIQRVSILINSFFENEEELSYLEYKNKIDEVNSNIFLLILSIIIKPLDEINKLKSYLEFSSKSIGKLNNCLRLNDVKKHDEKTFYEIGSLRPDELIISKSEEIHLKYLGCNLLKMKKKFASTNLLSLKEENNKNDIDIGMN